MSILTPAIVFRPYEVDGVPDSGKHDPKKSEIIQLLDTLFGANDAAWVVAPTLAALVLVTPDTEKDGGIVLSDPEATKNGYYYRDAGVWVRGRGFPDSLAVLEDIEGTANAITASTRAWVNPSDVQMMIFEVAATVEAGGVTIALNGGAAKPLVTNSGNAIGAGYLTAGMLVSFIDDGANYRLLSDVASLAIQAAAEAAADRAEQAVADAEAMIIPDGAVGFTKLSNPVRAAGLVNALRSAEIYGSGPSLDGSTFTDLLASTATLNIAGSSNYAFRKGGIEPSSAPGTVVPAAVLAQTGNSTSWTGYTVAVRANASAIADAAENKKFVRVKFKAGTGGTLTIEGAFIGVHAHPTSGEPGFDPAYPVVPLMFSGIASTGAIAAAASKTSDWAEFSIPTGKAIYIAFYVRAGGFLATVPASGWDYFQKSATNEPAKYAKTGYTMGTANTSLCVEAIETANTAFDNMTVVSKQLPVNVAPTKADVSLFLDAVSGDVGDIALSLSRDGATWKSVTLSGFFTINGKIGRAAYGVDLTAGAGTGNALYWRAVSSNNKPIKITGLAIQQTGGVFADVPSISMRESSPVVTRHNEATGLGYDSGGAVYYGRLWGFTQDWEVTGPTRFRISYRMNIEHLGVVTSVAYTTALTATYAATLAALGAKSFVETDTIPPTGNDSQKWLDFDSSNLASIEQHYANARFDLIYDVEKPGAYRFEVWAHSMRGGDGISGRLVVNNPEEYGFGKRAPYNRFQMTAEPLR